MSLKSFEPGTTTTISASTTSANASIGSSGNVIRIYNSGTVPVFVRWGAGAQTATTSDLPLAPGGVEMFSKFNADNVAVITASGTASVYVTPGSGAL